MNNDGVNLTPEVTPSELSIKVSAQEVIWSSGSDLADMLHFAHEKFPRMPWVGADGGVVLFGLSIGEDLDQVMVSLPAGADRSDLVEQMFTVRDIADDIGRTLDHIMSGQPIKKSLTQVVYEQHDRIAELEDDGDA